MVQNKNYLPHQKELFEKNEIGYRFLKALSSIPIAYSLIFPSKGYILGGVETVRGNPYSNKSSLEELDDTKKFWQETPWFRIRKWEESGRFYKTLGVGLFKRWNPLTGDHGVFTRQLFPDGSYQVSRDPTSLRDNIKSNTLSEAIHIAGFVVFTGMIATDLKSGDSQGTIIDGLVNVFFNIYPVMQQRYTRARLNRVVERLVNRGKSKKDTGSVGFSE